jgi:Family of unknown function (DUF6152)
MRHLLALLFLATVLALTIPALAHHSFAVHYFEEQSITVQGEIVEFEYKSPHAWVHVMAKDGDGQGQRFSAEWSNPKRLRQVNIDKDTLKAGDYVIITGSPGRNSSERAIHLKAIERPSDGWKWPARPRS